MRAVRIRKNKTINNRNTNRKQTKMKKMILCGAIAAMTIGFSACTGTGSSDKPETYGDSLSYYLGQAQGMGINQQLDRMPEVAANVDKKAFLAGFKAALDADTSLHGYLDGMGMGLQMAQQIKQWEDAGIKINRNMLYEQMSAALLADSVNEEKMQEANQTMAPLMEKAYQAIMNKRMIDQENAAKEAAKKFEENKKKGEEYIKNIVAKDKSVKVTESGLAYKVVKMGEGPVAKDGDRVPVIYTGKLIDGTEFDSSKGQVVPFSTNGVIPGFKEALTTLPAGTKVILYIPEDLAYGRQGSGQIEPGSTLVFDLDIQMPEAPKAETDSTVKK